MEDRVAEYILGQSAGQCSCVVVLRFYIALFSSLCETCRQRKNHITVLLRKRPYKIHQGILLHFFIRLSGTGIWISGINRAAALTHAAGRNPDLFEKSWLLPLPNLLVSLGGGDKVTH